ncbi:hypothetical protein J7I98_37765 [Streptomyces sp. ISL-98]|uniref:hypothetical protein n=1 Tax=Streptomyces sp. ISL-98 TaxID=2819192 RepID=UPI001BEA0F71|nr:hypothetical protein [Streptomyces sp. ISL-98]MBT2511451.1 hypothetical protein [Streptomyces sp. ISL-98]
MRRTTTTAIGAALLIASLTACGSSSEDPDAKAAPLPKAATSSPPEPTPTAAQRDLAVGDSTKIDDTANDVSFTAAVLSYAQPVEGPEPPGEALGGANAVRSTVELKVCNVKRQTFTVSQFPWSLA